MNGQMSVTKISPVAPNAAPLAQHDYRTEDMFVCRAVYRRGDGFTLVESFVPKHPGKMVKYVAHRYNSTGDLLNDWPEFCIEELL